MGKILLTTDENSFKKGYIALFWSLDIYETKMPYSCIVI